MPLPPTADLAIAGASVALLLAAAHDVAARTIPNRLVLAIGLLGGGARLAAGELAGGLAAAGLVFLLAFAAWRFGLMGGGDVKLLSAAALLVPAAWVTSLVLAVALAGGVLALGYLILRRLVPAPAALRPAGLAARALRAEAWRIRRGGPLPYAVAIALGAFATLGMTGA